MTSNLHHFLKISLAICDRIWEKGALRTKHDFLQLFNLPPFQGSGSPRLQTWFVSSLGLLLHRSNVRSLSKPPAPSGEPPKRAIKWRFSNAIGRPTHTGSGRSSRFAASVVGWWKNIHARFEVHSCYGSRDISTKIREMCEVPPFLKSGHIYMEYLAGNWIWQFGSLPWQPSY